MTKPKSSAGFLLKLIGVMVALAILSVAVGAMLSPGSDDGDVPKGAQPPGVQQTGAQTPDGNAAPGNPGAGTSGEKLSYKRTGPFDVNNPKGPCSGANAKGKVVMLVRKANENAPVSPTFLPAAGTPNPYFAYERRQKVDLFDWAATDKLDPNTVRVEASGTNGNGVYTVSRPTNPGGPPVSIASTWTFFRVCGVPI